MSATRKDFYLPESLWMIMKREEKCGNLKDKDYSPEVENMSSMLKYLREKLREFKPNLHKRMINVAELRLKIEKYWQNIDSKKGISEEGLKEWIDDLKIKLGNKKWMNEKELGVESLVSQKWIGKDELKKWIEKIVPQAVDFTNSAELGIEIEELRQKLEEKKKEELAQKAETISQGKALIEVKPVEIKNHQAFVADNIDTRLVCQIIKLELRRSYKLSPTDMNIVIEGLKGLLDNPMPKIIIRADITSFFESIPQQELIDKLRDDGFITRLSLRYLRKMMYEYNRISGKHDYIGVPRGLAFSSYLSELYMRPIDKKIRRMHGVYYYKRYVDDMVLVLDPTVATPEEYWNDLSAIFKKHKLSLHEDSRKKFMCLLDKATACANFEYLGYRFIYSKGKLEVRMSDKRYRKYQLLIDAIFEIYAKCANFHTKGKVDALKELFVRLKMLTSNGVLSGRKNYVATGIFYSNKHLTDDCQLRQLDTYLSLVIDSVERFNPPSTLFNYREEGNNYQENLDRIKKKLHGYSFMEGFHKRKIYKSARDSRTLLELQRIYYKKHEQVPADF